jgi:sarcosine oxidase subunit beta
MRTADVAIIGGGIIGCAIAHELSQKGVTNVALFERGSLAGAQTGICPGGIRQQFGTEPDCVLARRSVRFFEQANEILKPEMPFTFERSGYLFLAESESLLDQFRQNVAIQNRVGVPSEVVDRKQIREILPHLNLDGFIGGAWCAEDGFLEDCHGITNLLAQRARERGAKVYYEEVTQIARSGDGWQLTTPADRLTAMKVVLANGPDSVSLAANTGVPLPIFIERRRLAFTSPHPQQIMNPLVIVKEREFACKQLHYGVFYFGWLNETGKEEDLTFIERGLEGLVTMWPDFVDMAVRRVVAGDYDSTPDHRPILGSVPQVPDLYLAVGFSGHGYMIAPAVAEGVAAAVLEQPTDLPMHAFTLDRFAGQAVGERLVI